MANKIIKIVRFVMFCACLAGCDRPCSPACAALWHLRLASHHPLGGAGGWIETMYEKMSIYSLPLTKSTNLRKVKNKCTQKLVSAGEWIGAGEFTRLQNETRDRSSIIVNARRAGREVIELDFFFLVRREQLTFQTNDDGIFPLTALTALVDDVQPRRITKIDLCALSHWKIVRF